MRVPECQPSFLTCDSFNYVIEVADNRYPSDRKITKHLYKQSAEEI